MKLIKTFFLLLVLFLTSQLSAEIYEPVKWSIEHKKINKTSGELIIKAKIDNGWHLYGLNIPDGGPRATEITIQELQNARKIGKLTPKSKLITSYDSNFDMDLNWYKDEAIFVQKISFQDAKAVYANVVVNYMVCNDMNCLPPTNEILIFGKAGLTPTKNTKIKEVKVVTKEKKQKITIQPKKKVEKAIVSQNTETPKVSEANIDLWKPVVEELKAFGKTNHTSNRSFLWIFLAGFLGGFLALFTPCVWPIIPMTVSFFLKRSNDKRKGRRDAVLYGISIIVIYLVLGLLITFLFGASALNSLSTNAVFNLIFFGLLVLFAVSFFGAFEITLPASWSNKMDEKAESTSGILSILFMAFTLALVSFSCTGPIIGTLLVEVSVSGSYLAPAIGMFGFALALAIPFSLFAFFPSLLKNMPKSGGWLNRVKVVLAFLELALSLKFLSVADLAYGWEILDRETFLSLWIVIFALLGFYLIGKLRFPHDDEIKHTSVSGLFMGIISLSFAVYMIPGLWGAPLKAISAFSPPVTTQDFNLYENDVHAQFNDYELGMAYAKSVNKPALVDFTGYGCVNCRKMEVAVWTDERVRDILNNDYVLISLYVDDKTPLDTPYTIEENGKTRTLKTVGDKWSYLQRVKFESNAQPFYVILDKNGVPMTHSYSFDEEPKNFVNWLNFLKKK
ncbi:MAG: thiol:disulfide interchange protein [Paludibacter sp.]|nr:MAG: thiol:disulfide interchange protein [Paludibacter sp.]